MTRKSGHIWQIWAEMIQTLMPKSTKVAQIYLSECNCAKIRQISAKIRQISAEICQIAAKIRQISQISFHKRALTLNTQNISEMRTVTVSERVQFQTPSSVSFLPSPSSRGQTQWVPRSLLSKRTHRVFRRTHRVHHKTQWGSLSSLLRNSTLKTVFSPFPNNSGSGKCF